MNFQDNDIKFEMLEWKDFEELCFDLLLKYNFHSLQWRQGGSDGGRDIEAKYTHTNPLLGSYDEVWYIECKHYTNGLNVRQLSDKLTLASVDQLDHFLLFTSSYLTKDTWEWLEKKRPQLNFKIHVIEYKTLKKKILAFPELISSYFSNEVTKMVRELLKQWVFNDFLPSVQTLYRLSKEINPETLTDRELVFLIYAFNQLGADLNDIEDVEEFSFDFLIPFIIKQRNHNFPALTKDEQEDLNVRYYKGVSSTRSSREIGNNDGHRSFHRLEALNDDKELLEIYFKRTVYKQVEVRIAIYSEEVKEIEQE